MTFIIAFLSFALAIFAYREKLDREYREEKLRQLRAARIAELERERQALRDFFERC